MGRSRQSFDVFLSRLPTGPGMHTQHPRRFWLLFISVVTSGIVVAGAGLATNPPAWQAVVVLVSVVAVLESSPVNVNSDIKTSLSIVAFFIALLYGGMPLVVVVALATGVVSGVTATSNRLIKGFYNTGMDLSTAGAAAVVFAALSPGDLLHGAGASTDVAISDFTLGLLAAGLAYSVVNAIILGAAVHSIHAVPFRHTLLDVAKGIVMLQFVYVGLAAIAYVVLVRVSPLGLGLIAVPLLVARRSLKSVEERREAYDRMVRAFVKAIELKDGYTRGHAERVSDLSVLVAERMGLSYEDRQLIRYGAILHDVGKIGVSLGILCKAGPLDDDEFAEMKTHPEVGAAMLADIDFLKPALAVVHHHHERMDGRGYPAGLKGDEIPLLTRVVTAVDAFDAMTSTRSYRRALPIHVALEELQANAGTQFDATVVSHLVAVIAEHGWEVTDEPVAVAAADSSRTSLAMP